MKKELNGISMKKIAELANVSTATVSRVLRAPHQVKENSREAVFQSMRMLGLSPEEFPSEFEAVATGGTPLILILARFADDNLASRHIIRKIHEVISRNDFLAVCIDPFAMPKPLHKAILNFIKENNVQGVLTILQLEESLLEAIAETVPIIQIGDVNMCARTSIVTLDYFAATHKLITYLISHGCKNIASILVDTHMSDSSARKRRAYLSTLKDAGITPNPSYIIEVPKVDFNAAYSAATSLLKRDPLPDAIFCGTDIFAAAAIAACSQNNLSVPNDIMVTGYDDSIIASMTTPKLTSIRCPDLGYISTEILFDNIAHPSDRLEKILMDADMIIRGSTR